MVEGFCRRFGFGARVGSGFLVWRLWVRIGLRRRRSGVGWVWLDRFFFLVIAVGVFVEVVGRVRVFFRFRYFGG